MTHLDAKPSADEDRLAPAAVAPWPQLFQEAGLVATPLIAGVLMARWSVKSGRADRRGAARLTTFVAIVQVSATWLVMAHAGSPADMILLLQALVFPLIVSTVAWILYIELEPYIRRTWPSALTPTAWMAANGLRAALGAVANDINLAIFVSLMLLFVFCLVRMVARRDWIATTVFAIVFAGLLGAAAAATVRSPAGSLVMAVQGVVLGVVWAVMLVRFGLITFIAMQLTDALLGGVMTLNPSAWYAGSSFLHLAAFAALAAYSGWICLSMRRMHADGGTAVRSRAVRRGCSSDYPPNSFFSALIGAVTTLAKVLRGFSSVLGGPGTMWPNLSTVMGVLIGATWSVALRVCARPDRTVTAGTVYVAKPGQLTRTVYCPPGSGSWYFPSSPALAANSAPVSSLRAITSDPGKTAPVWS